MGRDSPYAISAFLWGDSVRLLTKPLRMRTTGALARTSGGSGGTLGAEVGGLSFGPAPRQPPTPKRKGNATFDGVSAAGKCHALTCLTAQPSTRGFPSVV